MSRGVLWRLWVLAVAICLGAYAGQGVSRIETHAPGNSSAPQHLLVVGDALYFAADDGIHGKELWRLDAEGNARLVGDFCPGPEGSHPRNLVALENRVYFVGLRRDYSRNKRLEFVWSVELTAADATCHWANRDDESVEGDISLVALGHELYGARTLGKSGRELVNFHRGFVFDAVPGMMGGVNKAQEYFAVLGDRLVFTVQPTGLSSRVLLAHHFMDAERGAHALQGVDTAASDIAFPLYGVAVNERIWFTGSVGESGAELCLTDGTAAGTVFVKDINPGPGDSMPKDFASHQGVVYFQANDGVHGIELWRSDGAEAGTWLVKDINPGPANSSPYYMRSIGAHLLFAATREDTGTELWRTDGTEEGTRLVMDIYPGAESSYLYQPTPFQGMLLFAANHPKYGEELWRSDGTPEGTFLVRDIQAGPKHSEPYYLTVFQNHVYFCANDSIHGEELWRSDGTSECTVLVADIRPQTRIVRSSNPTNLTAASDGLYFAADDLEVGNELWWTDADSRATHCVADIFPGPESSHPEGLVLFDDVLFFSADDGLHGRSLWRSDGADAIRVAALGKGPGISGIRLLCLTEQGLFFAASADQGDVVCWMRDTTAVPEVVADLASIGVMGEIATLRAYEKTVYACVRAKDGALRFAGVNTEDMRTLVYPYVFSASLSWERALALATEMDDPFGVPLLQCYFSLPSMRGRFIRFGENWLFAARTAAHGVELWTAEKEARDARFALDCFPGPASGSPDAFGIAGGELFFAADHPSKGRQLWHTDTTSEGAYVVPLWSGQVAQGMGPREPVEHQDALFYSATGGQSYGERRALTKCERSLNGLVIVPAAEPDRHWPDNPGELTSVGPWLYFAADHPATGRELWRYGTHKVGRHEYAAYALVHNIGSEPCYETDSQIHHYGLHQSP